MTDEWPAPPEIDLARDEMRSLLATGTVEMLGRVSWSSNATFLVTVRADGVEVPAIYKPRRGERPLWDFPEGTLCAREVASCLVDEALGWGIVPETVLRDGPLGEGMVQRFVDHDPGDHYFTLLETRGDELRRFAVFDVLINNADRKGGHVLHSTINGSLCGIDHGLSFHPAWKLRTVIWDFAGERIAPELLDAACRIRAELDGALGEELRPYLSTLEIEAAASRADELVRAGTLPHPEADYHSVPWPLV